MKRTLFAIAAVAAIAAGCSKNGPSPSFPDLAEVEAEARKLNDAGAVMLTVASALDDEATVQAGAAAMAACDGGPEPAACKAAARAGAVGAAGARREALKNAVAAQHALAEALERRAACRAGGDLACVAEATAAIAKRLPELVAQVEDLKGQLVK